MRLLPGWYSDAGPLSLYYPTKNLLPAKTRAFGDFILERLRSADFARLTSSMAGDGQPSSPTPAA